MSSTKKEIKDLFLIKENICNWETLPLFGNFKDINETNGTIQLYFYDFERIYNKCIENCKDLKNPSGCKEYCQKLKQYYKESLDFAKKKCPNRDKKCCKQAAQSNDYAYLACIKNDDNTKNILIIVIMVFIIFILICIIIKCNKK